jgi:hypothetical protein
MQADMYSTMKAILLQQLLLMIMYTAPGTELGIHLTLQCWRHSTRHCKQKNQTARTHITRQTSASPAMAFVSPLNRKRHDAKVGRQKSLSTMTCAAACEGAA